MATLTASSVSSRPWVLQFFRNLFGTRHVTQEGPGPKADAKEKEELKSQLLESPLLDTEAIVPSKEQDNTTSVKEIHGVMGCHTEKLLELKEISLGGITPTNEKKLPALRNSAGLEMGDSDDFADSMISHSAQDTNEKIPDSGKKNEESSGDRREVVMDGIAQVLSADNEGASMAAGGAEDCNAEEETEHLLKEDVRVELPKAELSPWSKLINIYKQHQRRRIPSSKVPCLQDIPAQPETEDEATVDLMIYEFATPKSHADLSNSPGKTSVCGLPDNEAGDLADHCETAQEDLRPNDAGSLELPKNLF